MWAWVSTDGIARQDRADWYHEAVARTVAPHRLKIANPAAFRARIGVLRLRGIEVSSHTHAVDSWRTPRLIRQSDPEQYLLGFVSGGSMGISLLRENSRIDTGGAVFFDTSHPYFAGPPDRAGAVITLLHIPRTALALPADRLGTAIGCGLPAHHGLGGVLHQFLLSLKTHAVECSPQELRLLERTALDLASGFLAQQLALQDRLPAETREQITLRTIDAFIDHHLADPALTPRAIAARHHISLRTLQHLFRKRGETVSAVIRRRRLERCHADLVDPAQQNRPIHAIASGWGLTGATVFSRMFRDAYGMSPRTVRQQARDRR
ncbi:helix-turn-helix domain-containing protein [Streptomyces sp. NPDC127068]|uniref:AraC-like ligand-binding domain-containing protein n=1 Tax=Streptomyces sp. NPDC127068 TaxID=3347127 RepID=UPI003653F621